MKTRKRHPHRAHIAMLLAITFVACAPATTQVTTEELSSRDEVEELTLHLHDGRTIVLESPHVAYTSIHGRVRACRGAPLTTLREGGLRWLPPGCVASGKLIAIRRADVRSVLVKKEGLGAGEKVAIALGVAAGAAAVAASTALLFDANTSDTQSSSEGQQWGSCPRVYSFDGQHWQLDSGTYGSAWFEAAEQTDHDLLDHLVPVGGRYRLRIRNELHETENVNAMALRIVDRPSTHEVVPAPNGELLTFGASMSPLSAKDLRGAEVLAAVAERDGERWESDLDGRDPNKPKDTRSGLRLQFSKPKGASELKLWLTGVNTRHASDVLFHLLALQGDALPDLYERLAKSRLARTMTRRLLVGVGLLTVSVRTPSGWSQRGVFEAAGNEVSKDQALRIPIDDIEGDRVELRLESAVGMWTIDRAVVDYGSEVPVHVRRLRPLVAVTGEGTDIRGALAKIDGARWSSENGEWAEIHFAAPPERSGFARSIVLETTGYDTLHVEPAADPNPVEANALMLSPAATSRRVLELLLAARALK